MRNFAQFNPYLTCLIVFLIYFLLLPHTPVPYADSAELITTGVTLSIPHPPGYPLLNFLVWVITKLPFSQSPAYFAHLLTALIHTVTIFISYHSLVRITKVLLPNLSKNTSAIYSSITCLTIAFSQLFFLHSIILEVFALNNLFASILVFLTLRIGLDPVINTKNMYLLFITLGLSIAHHQTIILILPAIIYFIYPKLKTIANNTLKLKCLLGFISSFLLSYSLMYISWKYLHTAPLSWAFSPSLIGWWRFITRADFSGNVLETGQAMGAYFKALDLLASLKTILHYFTHLLPQNFSWPIYIFVAFSWYLIYKSTKQRLKKFLILLVIIPGPLFAAYLAAPTLEVDTFAYSFYRTYSERLYLLGYLFIVLPMPLSLHIIESLINKSNSLINKSIIYTVFFLFPIWLLVQNYPTIKSATSSQPYDLARQSLVAMSPHSVLICFSDISCFLNAYLLYVDNLRPDITLVPVTPQIRYQHISQDHTIQRYAYPDNPYRIADIVSWNISQNRPIYTTEIPEYYINLLGLDGTVFYLQPGVYTHQVTCHPPQSPIDISQINYIFPLSSPYFLRHFEELLFNDYLANGTIAAHANQKDIAIEQLQLAEKLNAQHPAVTSRILALDSYPGNPRFQPGQTCPTAEDLILQSQQCRSQNNLSCTYTRLFQATLVEPLNIPARLLLAQHYLDQNSPQLAKREYQNVLSIDPSESTAKNQLDQLHNVADLPPLPWQY